MPRCRRVIAALPVGVALTLAGGVAAPSAVHADAATSPTTVPAPQTLPVAAPSRPVADAGDASAVVRWEPAPAVGATTKEYVVEASPSGKKVRAGGDVTAVKVSKLRNGAPTTFTVTAVNIAGVRTVSPRSNTVIPRKVARFAMTRHPARRVVFGSPTTVGARLVTPVGVGVPGQRVDLLAQVRPSTAWRRVASGTTNDRGGITLRTTLPAISRLRLHHPIGAVVANDRDLRAVSVAKRVTVRPGATPTRSGMRAVIRGLVAPAQRAGSPVYLERRVSGSWQRIASGRMTTRRQYLVRWNPTRTGRYVLRVRKLGDAVRAAGVSRSWIHRVNPESSLDVARDILRDGGITLATVHVSAGSDGATARQNIVDVANGRRARHSCHGGAPCGSTPLDLRMLRAVRAMGRRGTLSVSEFAGGVHAGRSAHYTGDAVDITWVNGRHVGPGSGYGMVVDMCREFGASEIYTPSNDPWGGHSRHVHCAWS